jgi:hypothetical protein
MRRERSVSTLLNGNKTALSEIVSKAQFLKGNNHLLEQFLQKAKPTLIGRCCIANIREGQLVIQADSAAWATQLRFLTASLLTWFRTSGGMPALTGVKVIMKQF